MSATTQKSAETVAGMKTRHPGIDCWFLVFVTTGNEWPCLLCELERLARSLLKLLMALDGGNSGNQANQPKVQSCRIQQTPLFDIGKVYDHTEACCLSESANLARDNFYRPEKSNEIWAISQRLEKQDAEIKEMADEFRTIVTA